jgi:hypothetical protein
MRDNPTEIADHLMKEHGLGEALSVVDVGKAEANRIGDYYALSVWREVRAILGNRAEPIDNTQDQPK